MEEETIETAYIVEDLQIDDREAARRWYLENVQEGPIVRSTSGYAIASLVTGIISFFIFGLILGALAIFFGKVALERIDDDTEELSGRGIAIAGIVLGIVNIAIFLFLIIAIGLLILMG